MILLTNLTFFQNKLVANVMKEIMSKVGLSLTTFDLVIRVLTEWSLNNINSLIKSTLELIIS
jgi:hypothetical protein